MSMQLTIDQMLELLTDLDPEEGARMQVVIEQAGTFMAKTIAKKLGCAAGRASFEGIGVYLTCAPFWASSPGQVCPDILAEFDDPAEFQNAPTHDPGMDQ